MADIPTSPDNIEARAFLRHAELVSASIVRLQSLLQNYGWTLKQVQGDDIEGIA